MITVQASNHLTAAKQAFYDLYEKGAENTSDRSIWREDTAAIEISAPLMGETDGFSIKDSRFRYLGNYAAYFPTVDPALITAEEEDYSELFLQSGGLKTLVEHFRLYPDSRRQLFSSWLPMHMDPKVVGVCITQLYCRLRNNTLELHSHARANDAYRLLLLDMQLAMSVQREIASQLNVPLGRYTHFVDSLHFYKQYESDIERQRAYMQTSPHWNGAL